MKNIMRKRYIAVLALTVVLAFSAATLAYTYIRPTYPVLRHVPTPKSVLGYDIGEEGYLTYYYQIVNYYKLVDKSSNRVKVVEIGKSTEGRPMVMAIVTAPENFPKLEYYKSIIKTLADPRKITKEESEYLASIGKPVVFIEPNIHSTEVSSAEMCMSLLYKLAAYTDPKVQNILDNTITLILASANPDGHDMVTEWYYKYKGTIYEGKWPPNYHKYIGHDNNRDFLAFQIVESEVLASTWNEWLPTVHYSLHQMGSYGYRINYVPHADVATYFEVHPTVLSEWIVLGGHVQNDLASKGLKGYACEQYAGALWYPGSTVGYTLGHYVTGTFSETAGTWGGTSLYIDPARLSQAAKEKHWYHWDPWPGGWWSLKDTVTYEETAAFAILSCVAEYHEQFLHNFAMRVRDHYEKGLTEPPYAFVLPPLTQQKDPVTAAKLLNRLIFDLVEVHVANKPFVADGVTYPAGSYVILMAQPMRQWAKTLLEVQKYPPVPPYPTPYDVTAWTRGYMMGVDVIQVNGSFSADLSLVKKVFPPAGEVIGAPATYAYVFSHELNNAVIAVNRLLKDGYKVYWAAEPFTMAGKTWPAGSIIVPVSPGLHDKVKSLAKDLYLKIYGTNTPLINGANGAIKVYELKQPRIGLYLPVVGGKSNMEEGHTRRILELYEFSFKEGVLDAEIIAGNLNEKYDVLIMADGSYTGFYRGPTQPYPLPGGLGAAGAASLRDFVKNGGTLIGIGNGGGLFPIKYFGVDLGVTQADTTDLFCPGTILRIKVNNTHPIGYGMNPEAAAFFWSSPAYDVTTAITVSWYPDKDLFMSGYITGESKLYNKGAIVDAPLGDGRVILIGFSVLQRGQSDNTFMLLFNSIYYGVAKPTTLPK